MNTRIMPVATLNADHTFSCYPAYDGDTVVPETRWQELQKAGYKLEYGYYHKVKGLN